jgi:hypothetical protein
MLTLVDSKFTVSSVLNLLASKQLAAIVIAEVLRLQNSQIPYRGEKGEFTTEPWQEDEDDPLLQAVEKPVHPLEGHTSNDKLKVKDFDKEVIQLSFPIKFVSAALDLASAVERQYNADQWTKKSNRQLVIQRFSSMCILMSHHLIS